MSSMNFLVVRDPGPYPLAKDAELCIREVVYCLKNRGFYPETILFDQKENTTHTVRTRQDNKLVLDPPSHRVDQHIMHLSRSSSRTRRATASSASTGATASASM